MGYNLPNKMTGNNLKKNLTKEWANCETEFFKNRKFRK